MNVGSIRVILPTFILEPDFLYDNSYFIHILTTIHFLHIVLNGLAAGCAILR